MKITLTKQKQELIKDFEKTFKLTFSEIYKYYPKRYINNLMKIAINLDSIKTPLENFVRNVLELNTYSGINLKFVNSEFFTRIFREAPKVYPYSFWYGPFGVICRMLRNLESEGKATFYEINSDRSSIKIATENFVLNLNHFGGDGAQYLFIVKRGAKFNTDLFDTEYTQLKGKFNVYNYDCTGGDIIATLKGDYSFMHYKGISVLFDTRYETDFAGEDD